MKIQKRGLRIEHIGLTTRKELDVAGVVVVKAIGAFVAAGVWASVGLIVTAIALGLM